MKEDLKLPWKLKPRETTFFKNYSVHDSEGNYVMDDEDYESMAPSREQANYILKAANNFPEAVRLLKESRSILETFNLENTYEYNDLNQFLTKLEENENI